MRTRPHVMTALLAANMGMILHCSVWAAPVAVPPQQKKTYTKAKVTWPKLSATSSFSFAVACGNAATVCAAVTPARLVSKFTWEDAAGVLTVTTGADPACNGGNGGFLTIQGPATGCSASQQTITAKLNGKVVSTAQGAIFDFVGTLISVDNFTGRNQDKYGIAEQVNLGVTISPVTLSPGDIGDFTWTVDSGVGSVVTALPDGTGTYDAGASPGNVLLRLGITSGSSQGASKSYAKTVVAPSGELMVRVPGTGLYHVQDTASVGFKANIFLLPKDVSFNSDFRGALTVMAI